MNCKFCDTTLGMPIFDIGNTAISNDLIAEDRFHCLESIYPLILYICPQCLLVQIEQHKEGYEIFNEDYVYFSSYSSYWLKHSRQYVDHIVRKLSLDSRSLVIEVASNDGYLLTNFVEKNIPCFGIEPTNSTALVAIEKNVPTLVEFFNTRLANKLVEEKKTADLIIANNVLAHVPDINNFVSSLKKVLKKNGTITIEFPHVLSLVEKNEFDTIYHEHFFYFSILSLINIFNKYDLSIYDLDELETHGGSIRVYVTHTGNDIDKNNSKNNVDMMAKKELHLGLDSSKFYEKLRHNSLDIKLNSLQYLIQKKMHGGRIVAFGAAAKGNTFLNYCGIKADLIEAVIDETPYKIGKYMPQSKIPILPFKSIIDLKPEVIVILPWNHQSEIMHKLDFTKEWGCEIIVFIPQLKKLQ